MTPMQGRPAEYDDSFWADPPSVWWKWSVEGGTCWMVRPPRGHHFLIDRIRAVDEHDDGMITIKPKPGNSNSILCQCSWRGCIDHGVW